MLNILETLEGCPSEKKQEYKLEFKKNYGGWA